MRYKSIDANGKNSKLSIKLKLIKFQNLKQYVCEDYWDKKMLGDWNNSSE